MSLIIFEKVTFQRNWEKFKPEALSQSSWRPWGAVSSLVGSRGKDPEVPGNLMYLSRKNS